MTTETPTPPETSTPSTPPVPTSTLTAAPESSTSQEVLQQTTSVQDYVILRYAVVGLILIALVAIIGSLLLIKLNDEVQAGVTAIIALGGVAVGGLSTMLVRPPLYPNPPAVKLGAYDRRVA